MEQSDLLTSLVEKWEQSARFAFNSAEVQIDDPNKRPTGKQFIELGAICYFNCAQDLRRSLNLPDLSFQPLLDKVEGKTSSAIEKLASCFDPQ